LGKDAKYRVSTNNLLIQNEDVLFNPRNPENPDSKLIGSGDIPPKYPSIHPNRRLTAQIFVMVISEGLQ
jgi:hypothetical protein